MFISKKILLVSLMASPLVAGPMTIFKNSVDGVADHMVGYREISPEYYPKATAYFDGLREKYSDVLENINILMHNPDISSAGLVTNNQVRLNYKSQFSPQGYLNSVYFPEKWIALLEKEDAYYQNLTEWMLLKHAGYMYNNEALKGAAAALLTVVCSSMSVSAINKNNRFSALAVGPDNTAALTPPSSSNYWKSLGFGVVACSSAIYLIFKIFARDYIADNYASEICNNPKAFQAAYEYIDRSSPRGLIPGLFGSFADIRLSNMKTIFKLKFGYELTITPSSAMIL